MSRKYSWYSGRLFKVILFKKILSNKVSDHQQSGQGPFEGPSSYFNLYWWSLIFCIALTVSCRGAGVVKVADFPQSDETLPSTITVVNWNIQKGAHPQFSADLAKLLEQENADVVFLQEARADLEQVEPMGGYFANSWSYPWPGGVMVGVLTLSKISPVNIDPVSTKYREFFVTAPKVSLITEYPLPNGESLLAVNVHLLNFELWGDLKIRDQLKDLKSILKFHSGPVIMAGDFNTWNENRLELVDEVTTELNLSEVTQFPGGRKTGDLKSDFLNAIIGIQSELPLDRVYYRGFAIKSARILPYESSDHPPIAVRLTLKEF
jgi:endonuclease/exonuclease/phosphatase (EEP) superfamily protein YafD